MSNKVDPDTGLTTWRLEDSGLGLELAQLLPDQTRAFFQGRDFPAEIADRIATSCVFQVIGRNNSQGEKSAAVSISLGQWRIRHADREHPVKLKEVWDQEWPVGSISRASRIAFRWATFPTEQTFEPGGDYNWGMLSFGPPPGTRFDVHVFWQTDGQSRDAWIKNLECAVDR